MPEIIPTPEKGESEDVKNARLFNKYAAIFFALDDKPKTTYEKQNWFVGQSQLFYRMASEEKDPVKIKEYLDKYEEYKAKYEQSRRHKFAAGKYTAPLGAAKEFLDATKGIPEKHKEELLIELNNIYDIIDKAKPTGMTQEIVDRAIQFLKKIQEYTQKYA